MCWQPVVAFHATFFVHCLLSRFFYFMLQDIYRSSVCTAQGDITVSRIHTFVNYVF